VAPGEPSQIHLALGASADAMAVTWVTKLPCNASRVSWGAGATALAATYTYTVPDRWWQPKAQKWVHTATMHGLAPGAPLAYTVGDVTSPGCTVSPVVDARAPAAAGSLPYSAALMADVGSIEILGFETWRALHERTASGALDVDLCVHTGDVSYAGMDTSIPFLNVTKADEWEPLWDVYGSAHQNFTRRRPYHIGVGNHEAWYNWTALRHRYPMAQGAAAPADVSRLAQLPFWWSFESGGVHWTMLSSEHDYYAGSPQRAFADAALAAVDRSRTPWSVVTFHRPMYCSDAAEYPDTSPGSQRQRELEPLLLAHAVDLVVTGHLHGYERVHPNVAGNVTDLPTRVAGEDVYTRPAAPVHLMVGHGGAVQDFSWVTPPPAWSAARMSSGCDFSGAARDCDRHADGYSYTATYGFAHARFANRTHARFHTEMVSGALGDAFWLVRADAA
jgi:hypothetical protein